MKFHEILHFSPSEASIFHAPEILFWIPSRAQAPTGKFLRYCLGGKGVGGRGLLYRSSHLPLSNSPPHSITLPPEAKA